MQVTRFSIKRYDFSKKFISEGLLTVVSDGPSEKLIYKDSFIEETATASPAPVRSRVVTRWIHIS